MFARLGGGVLKASCGIIVVCIAVALLDDCLWQRLLLVSVYRPGAGATQGKVEVTGGSGKIRWSPGKAGQGQDRPGLSVWAVVVCLWWSVPG